MLIQAFSFTVRITKVGKEKWASINGESSSQTVWENRLYAVFVIKRWNPCLCYRVYVSEQENIEYMKTPWPRWQLLQTNTVSVDNEVLLRSLNLFLENCEMAQSKVSDSKSLLNGSINNYLKSLQFQHIINIKQQFVGFFENSWKAGMGDQLVMFI